MFQLANFTSTTTGLMRLRIDAQRHIDEALIFRALYLEPCQHVGIHAQHQRHFACRQTQLGIGKNEPANGGMSDVSISPSVIVSTRAQSIF